MKAREDIQAAWMEVDPHAGEYPGMSYEQGVEEALMWVLGELTDEEFIYSQRAKSDGP